MPGDGPSSKPSDAATLGYSRRKVAETLAKANLEIAGMDLVGRIGEKGFDLLIELVRAGVSNPVLGATGAIIIANILQRGKVISPNAEGLVDGVALAVVGVSLGEVVAGEIANVIDALNPIDIFKQQSNPPNGLVPTATTVVFGSSTRRPPLPTLRTTDGMLALTSGE